ncbi:MAG: hypothetical protein J7M26_08940, partial [Armatimonadetes bacterium]|nr:hypothetical protein [Armatimonadota bacterium]
MSLKHVFPRVVMGVVVMGATSCAAAPARDATARLLWRGVDEFSTATAENTMQATVRKKASVGNRAMDAIFLHPLATGQATLSFPPVRISLARERVFFLTYVGIAEGFDWKSKEHTPDGVGFHVLWQGREVASTYLKASKWEPLVAPLYEPPAGTARWSAQLTGKPVLATDSGPAHSADYDWALFGEPLIVTVPAEPLAQGESVSGTTGIVLAQLQGGQGGRLLVEGLDAAGNPVPDAQASE